MPLVVGGDQLTLTLASEAGSELLVTDIFDENGDLVGRAIYRNPRDIRDPYLNGNIAFPLLGGRVLFMCNNHLMMHLGQISAWRRCMGLPAA